jgi:hypothetical protein
MSRGRWPGLVTGLSAGLLFAMTLATVPAPAWAQLVPANLRAAIFVRALGYERSFVGASSSAELVVVKGSSGEAARDGAAMARAFREILRAGGTRRTVNVREVTHRDLAATVEAVEGHDPTVVYLPRGMYEVGERLSGTRNLIVLCAAAQGMERACSLSVEVSGSSPRLVVNLAQANRAGLRFDARLLGLSRVIR